MIVLPWFAFVHVHKTGGGFVRKLLHDHYGDRISYETAVTHLAGHESFDGLPEGYDAPVLAFVRNPWDWYVSWYHFMMERLDDNVLTAPFLNVVFGGGKNDFATAVRILCNAEARHPLPEVSAAMDAGHDFCTAAVMYMLGRGVGNARLTVGRFEFLREHLATFVADSQAPGKEALAQAAATAPPERQSRHRPYRDYYDAELRDLVGRRADWLIERYEYAF